MTYENDGSFYCEMNNFMDFVKKENLAFKIEFSNESPSEMEINVWGADHSDPSCSYYCKKCTSIRSFIDFFKINQSQERVNRDI